VFYNSIQTHYPVTQRPSTRLLSPKDGRLPSSSTTMGTKPLTHGHQAFNTWAFGDIEGPNWQCSNLRYSFIQLLLKKIFCAYVRSSLYITMLSVLVNHGLHASAFFNKNCEQHRDYAFPFHSPTL
jgi:hypothetical protein